MPCTTMQGQMLLSLTYNRTRAADMTLVSSVGPKPKNFRWTRVNRDHDTRAAAHLRPVNVVILSMRYPR